MTGFNRNMAALADALYGQGAGSVAATLVADESRRMLRQLIRFTPPQTQKQGERAVGAEIHNLASEASYEFLSEIGSAHGTTNIDVRIRSPKYPGVSRLLWGRICMSEDSFAAAHKAARQPSTGKVPLQYFSNPSEWRRRVVVPRGVRSRYIDKMKKRVGRWKASWAVSLEIICQATGVNFPVAPWVRRHVPTPKAVRANPTTLSGAFPTIAFGSRSPGVSRQRGVVENSIRVRAEAMRRRAALVISGWNEEMKRGMMDASKVTRIARQKAKPSIEYGESGVSY